MVSDAEVFPGDLLVVDRSLDAQNHALVVGVMEGQMVVLRVSKQDARLLPALATKQEATDSFEVWGVVSYIIRKA